MLKSEEKYQELYTGKGLVGEWGTEGEALWIAEL